MELPAPAEQRVREPRSGWRRVALIVGAVAAVELVALVVIALAFIARPFAGDAAPAPTTQAASSTDVEPAAATHEATMPKVTRAAAEIPRAKTPVLVLNGNGVVGAASQAAGRVRARRYPVAGIADAQRRTFPRSLVMFRPGFKGEAQRLARDLGLDLGSAVPLDGIQAGALGSAKLVLIVGGS